jgi:hypothetical protein
MVAFEVVESVLEAACSRAETAENLRSDPPAFASKAFMRKLGLTGADAHTVAWTADLIRRGVLFYAGFTEEPAERFVSGVQTDLAAWADERARTVRRLEREAAAVVRLLDGGSVRKQTAKLLPGDGRDERIAKYERHLAQSAHVHPARTGAIPGPPRGSVGAPAGGGGCERDGRSGAGLNRTVGLFWRTD